MLGRTVVRFISTIFEIAGWLLLLGGAFGGYAFGSSGEAGSPFLMAILGLFLGLLATVLLLGPLYIVLDINRHLGQISKKLDRPTDTTLTPAK